MGQHLNKKFFVQQRKLSTKWEDIFVNDTSYKTQHQKNKQPNLQNGQRT